MDETRARKLLSERRQELEEALAGLESGGDVGHTEQEATGELAAYDQHPAEQASETLAAETDGAVAAHLRSQLDEVDAAVARLQGGSYGRCETCGRPISDERLEALPATRYCVEHEIQMEDAAASSGRASTP